MQLILLCESFDSSFPRRKNAGNRCLLLVAVCRPVGSFLRLFFFLSFTGVICASSACRLIQCTEGGGMGGGGRTRGRERGARRGGVGREYKFRVRTVCLEEIFVLISSTPQTDEL